jgi:hypothetical protein
MNLKGEPAYVGRFCGSSLYEVTPELVAFYEQALDHRDPLHREAAPPLLFHSECYRFLAEWYLANLFGNLHARQDWELFGAIPVGARVRTRSTIVERYRKRGRDYVVNETDVADAADGRLLVRGRTHQSFLPSRERAEGEGYVVDEGTARRKEVRPEPPPARGPELAPVKKTVDARRCWMFSGPGRNYHTDREAARQLGFPNIVVQGMMATCFVAEVMQQAFGRGWLVGGQASLKLVNVLWVDESVTAGGRVREETPEGPSTRVHCDVWVDKDDGTRVLAGVASGLRPAG